MSDLRCTRCWIDPDRSIFEAAAVIYAGESLCSRHFQEIIEMKRKAAAKTVRRNKPEAVKR